MANTVIGIDPDAKKHGIAIYHDKKLLRLLMLDLYDTVQLLRNEPGVFVAIEDVMANKFVYSRNRKPTKAQESRVAMSIGRAQQAQVELCRLMDRFAIPYRLFKPQRGNWAKNSKQFEQLTGWTGKSNEDTRAAAFFGFLALNSARTP